MSDASLNADFSQAVVMKTAAMDWQASPSPTVWRKRLDLSGPKEAGRVTSVVRYDAGSSFHAHPHPDGEEIFVLDGVFSDESGGYPAGSFLLNPEGFEHAPFSKEGCILFVKLRQYVGLERTHLTVNTLAEPWHDLGGGVSRLVLYDEQSYPERIQMVRLEAESQMMTPADSKGAEVFLLSGTLVDVNGRYETGDWLRWPAHEARALTAKTPVILYLKTGHFQI